ncbi:Veg family protein [Wukongibacter baidiensis]|uniref:Veg family protein n=1 Tax=Wukongibacter baidiensis TaxID=1723361 RepID=UPI003D7FC1B0
MATKETLTNLKKNVESYIGQKVILKTNKGRKRVFVKEGVLEEVYQNIFIVRIDRGLNSERKVSYSYSDILTETVEITLCSDASKIQAS